MLDPRLRKRIDWPLLGFAFALAIFGVVIIYSATHGDPTAFYKKQLIWIGIGSVGMVAAALLDYHIYARFSRHFYLLNLALLGFIVKFGHASNGAARWIKLGIFQFQPSEFAKLFLILTLGFFLAKRGDAIRKPQILLLSFVFIAIPMALIIKQPDLGTGLVVLAIWFGMVYMAGAKLLHLVAFVGAGAILFSAMWITGKGLNDYQKHRIEVWLHPELDPKKTGYHVWQARIAIGSGGMWGKGLLQSTQVKGGYIPEKQTDFIYTDVGEELGFVGCVLVLVLYGGLLYRGVVIIATADEDISGKLIATGVVTMFAFHVIENIGMNIGMMPVAGVPLLLISYGGSSMITTLFCIGLLESVSMHRHQLTF